MKSQGAKLSFSSVSVRKGNACALSLISPFFWLLAGLAALRAANRRQIKETPEKPRSRAPAFRAFLCVGDAPGLSPCPGKQELSAGTHPERTACVRGSNADTNTVRVLLTAGARACAAQMQTQTQCASCPPQVRVRARRGEEKDTVRELPGAAARGRSRQGKPLCGQPTHYKLHRG